RRLRAASSFSRPGGAENPIVRLPAAVARFSSRGTLRRERGVPLRVFMVDDSPEALKSVSQFLAETPGIELVGVALSGEESLPELARLKPDVVLMDLAMPGMGGLEATRRIKASPTAPRVLLL